MVKIYDRLLETRGRDLSLDIDSEWRLFGLQRRSFAINSRGDINMDGTVLQSLDGEKGFEEFTRRVGKVIDTRGEFAAMRTYSGKSEKPGELGAEVNESVNYVRNQDLAELRRKKNVFQELAQINGDDL